MPEFCIAVVATNKTIAVLMHSLSNFSVVLSVVRGWVRCSLCRSVGDGRVKNEKAKEFTG